MIYDTVTEVKSTSIDNRMFFNNFVHTHVPLSTSRINCYR